ncbi:MAG: PDZ domain-containing protein, partial [Alphaproteobacteria bacterium]
MELASPGMAYTIVMFLIVLTVIVFVHEMGHYLTARLFKVRVEVFSIGFGREIFGWNDGHGTRWKISALPFGGYVKFFGDSGVASAPDSAVAARMSAAERAVAFQFKPVWQRALIVAAGPLINILLAIVIYTGLFATLGQAITPPRITAVVEDSPAAQAGFQPGDLIVAIDGSPVDRFEDVARQISMLPEQRVAITVERAGRRLTLSAVPQRVEIKDRFGNRYEIGRVGVQGT